MLNLNEMKPIVFDELMKVEVQNYADEKVKAGTWTQEEALQKSKESFQLLLPEGLKTVDHYLLSLSKPDTNESIGYFWYHFDENHPQKEAFIYNFVIFEPYRGQGLGRRALETLEKHVKKQGVKKLSLHVFAHNERAIHLYKESMYHITDITMSKVIR
ncbi:GNAT family N-acetyltransferase [Halobacillus halophilus]|uniref:GNAT family N-acetyltransferase n=1 Tax=Halobacillus halophilus TaxID=1570 RepID=UPI001CD4633C|nr:GNAT family N-acetyltransferase [Halobacillus halophilus]MCA1009367.1 GNAT family N-acetyltransferase [Halobacillus halophilus]